MRPSEQRIFKTGSCILTETPWVFALKSQFRTEKCDHCLENKNGKVLKCSGCCYVYYCGPDCQKEAWTQGHKVECKALKKIVPRIVPDAARMLAKIIIKLEKGGDLDRGFYTKTHSRKFRDLMSHYQDIKDDAKRMEHLEALQVVLSSLLGDTPVPNMNELIGIYGRLITNGFNMLDGEMNSVATGLYLGISIVDHSCTPNAVVTFDGTRLFVRTLVDIPEPVNWDQVFISYIDLMNETSSRRQMLKENYYFLCICDKCVCNEEEERDMRRCVCPKCSSGIDMFEKNEGLICPTCHQPISKEFLDEYLEVLDFTQQKLGEMQQTGYFDVLKILLKRQTAFHALNLWHVKTLDLAFEAAILLEKFPEALEMGRKALPGIRKYNGDLHPLLGIHLLKLGKLELFMDHKADANYHLKNAEQILKITHGPEHSFYQNKLIPLLMEAQM